MGWIITIIVGGIIGWIASIIAKTNDQMGCLWNIVVGVAGAALGAFIASLIGIEMQDGFSLVGLLIGIGGAVLLVFILRAIGILKRDR